jgi:TDG/mug DNA glycosylase family protein
LAKATLPDHLLYDHRLGRPFKAVIVGINPSPVSVSAGHYYQGALGQRLWSRLQAFGILKGLVPGREDEGAVAQGIGFTDLLKRPTARAAELSASELAEGTAGLVARLKEAFPVRDLEKPIILFVFKMTDDIAGNAIRDAGFATYRLPAPYAPRAVVERTMKTIEILLKQS